MPTVTRTVLVAATLVLASVVHAEAQDESDCIAGLYRAAGKYQGCETKAFATKAFGPARRDDALLKCREKYATAWTKLGVKYPGTSCDQPRFTDNGTTITDNLTRLVWEKKVSLDEVANPSDRHDVDNSYSWSSTASNADGTVFTDFLDDLNASGFAGQRDWRLPTIVELHTIVSFVPCPSQPCIVDPIFAPSQSFTYWSSTTSPNGELAAWDVYFLGGKMGNTNKTYFRYARAVRAGL